MNDQPICSAVRPIETKMDSLPWQDKESIYSLLLHPPQPGTDPLNTRFNSPCPDTSSSTPLPSCHRFPFGLVTGKLSAISENGGLIEQISCYNILKPLYDEDGFQFLTEMVLSLDLTPFPYLYEFAKKLMIKGCDIGPVKMGIYLVGQMGQPEDCRYLEVFGQHDIFVLSAAKAIKHLADTPDPAIQNMLKRTHPDKRAALMQLLETRSTAFHFDWTRLPGHANVNR